MRNILISLLVFFCLDASANNVRVSDPVITDPLANEAKIGIQVTWDNSWRCEAGQAPHNYDAVWIFVKYKRSDKQDWEHALISSVTPGSEAETRVPTDKMGVMFYRKNPGYGTFSESLTINWDRSTIEVANRPLVASEICVFAIEMVQVPQGAFYMGDGSDGTTYGVWIQGLSNPVQPYKVTGEGVIATSNNPSYVYNMHYRGIGQLATSLNTTGTTSLPAPFPKGFNEFFCMKTEISQGQYCAFLNKLNSLQVNSDNIQKNYSIISLEFGDEDIIAQYGNTITKNDQGIYEVGDPYRACNFLTSHKVLAYLCWSGLRPMTEMEYEKACRGTITPRPGEFAWGRPAPTNKPAKAFVGSDEFETYTVGNSKDSANYLISAIPRPGAVASPGRVGAFAQANTNRIQAGASYYGILDLSGSLSELVVTALYLNASTPNWPYSRVHGNGNPLRTPGNVASWPSTWPQITAATSFNNGYAHRGGSFMSSPPNGNVLVDNYDPSSGIVSEMGVLGGDGKGAMKTVYKGFAYDYSYGTYPNTTVGRAGYFLHGYGGRGVRSF